ncbi:glycine-rich RNA-binding protein 4, mitochondrial isoform X2 [Trifolium pratense]|uniref:glycine-rich RNA-binding protein 4, mitochondrial isoform X2 n=1 Tax=Trifolium pratense TaxID=57577 RepID=UPI001E694C30|nr:glycine-rich RNA-binding protein 4, mitochondrial isoform X2 [Trifolium pratense]
MTLRNGIICKPQIVLFPCSSNFKQSISEITFSTPSTLSLSISSSTALRNAHFPLFCSISSSSVETNNMSSSTKIFIKGLPLATSEAQLTEAFSVFGEVTQVKLLIDKESGQSLGFAYIWFVKEEAAQLAAKEMNGKFFYGKFIYVTIANPGSSKSSKKTTAYKF